MKIAGKAPINKSSALVTGPGIQYQCPARVAQPHWDVPPPTIPLMQNQPDLTGRKCGQFTVVGLLETGGGKGCSKWLVRCVCGRYEKRKSSKITAQKDVEDCCVECRQLLFTKRRAYFNEHGRDRES